MGQGRLSGLGRLAVSPLVPEALAPLGAHCANALLYLLKPACTRARRHSLLFTHPGIREWVNRNRPVYPISVLVAVMTSKMSPLFSNGRLHFRAK
jgi:hypothetical protein